MTTNTEAIARVHIGHDSDGIPTITVDNDYQDRAAARIVAYVGRRGIGFDALAQSLSFPADQADRRHRKNVAALVARWAKPQE